MTVENTLSFIFYLSTERSNRLVFSCHWRLKIVRKRRTNFVVFRRDVGDQIEVPVVCLGRVLRASENSSVLCLAKSGLSRLVYHRAWGNGWVKGAEGTAKPLALDAAVFPCYSHRFCDGFSRCKKGNDPHELPKSNKIKLLLAQKECSQYSVSGA